MCIRDRRWATKTAGALAQVKVERIINEPSAAALAQHIHDDGEDKTFLIIDFGGGTLEDVYKRQGINHGISKVLS